MRSMHERTGCKILIKGKGAQRDGSLYDPTADEDEIHVALEGPEEAVEKAIREVEDILYNPEKAMRLKQEQQEQLADMNGTLFTPSSAAAGNIYGPGSSDDMVIHVPNNLVGLIIGRGGEQVQRLVAQTGAHLLIQKGV